MVSKQWFVHASVLFLLFQLCTSIHILSPSRSLTDGGDVLVSKGKTFALGFFSPGNSKNRYVGIWFNVPEKIVVWVANRDNPIKDSAGVLTINGDGNLVIFDGDRSSPLWSTNVSLKTKNSTAKLLDTGNLVLSDGPSNRLLWQSFDYPTHTFLQGMKIGLNRKTGLFWNITSWKSRDDPAPGNYSITLNPRGSPQFFWYKGDLTPYCSSGRWDGLGFSGEPAMRPIRLVRHIFVNNDDEVSLRFVTANSSISSRMVLDEFGYMQRLTSLDGNRHWNVYWTGPTDTCAYYGKCGANGICTSGKVVACQCFPGFKPKYPRQWDLRDWTGGCVRKRALECGKGEGFLKLAQVKVPDSSISRVDMNSSLKDCGKECLKNCSCTAYASADIRSGGRGCITWYGGLMDVRQFTEGGQDLYIRVDADVIAQSRRELEGFLDKEHMVVILTVSLDVGILFMGLGGYYLLKKRRTRKKVEKRRHREQTLLNLITRPTSSKDSPDAYDLDDNRTNPELQFFDLNAIVAATDNFSSSKRLGQGGFGFVYKGQLSDGQEIAVKRLSKNSGQGLEEFRNEVTLIVKLQHRNLVRLLGCCIQEEEKMLIYEYMSNKSLDTFIFDQSRRALLDWRKRFEIIVGIARGILYLHQDSRFRVIHRDLKASNILLNEDLNPKISDFGTARIFVDNQTQANTKRVVGTYGYMSPEYAMKGLFSIKSDVFSFGVLLLEIISGKNNNYYQEDPSLNLIEQAWDLWREGKVWEIVDSSMVDLCPTQEVLRCIQVGLLCVQENASDRPTMSSVVFMLVNETSMPPPNQPPFLVKETLKDRHSSSIDEATITMVDAR